jgi:hypothetical protein
MFTIAFARFRARLRWRQSDPKAEAVNSRPASVPLDAIVCRCVSLRGFRRRFCRYYLTLQRACAPESF